MHHPTVLRNKEYKWDFIIAKVSRPLLGADFLHANLLLVDLKGKGLVDTGTYMYFSTPLCKAGSLVSTSAPFHPTTSTTCYWQNFLKPQRLISLILLLSMA